METARGSLQPPSEHNGDRNGSELLGLNSMHGCNLDTYLDLLWHWAMTLTFESMLLEYYFMTPIHIPSSQHQIWYQPRHVLINFPDNAYLNSIHGGHLGNDIIWPWPLTNDYENIFYDIYSKLTLSNLIPNTP